MIDFYQKVVKAQTTNSGFWFWLQFLFGLILTFFLISNPILGQTKLPSLENRMTNFFHSTSSVTRIGNLVAAPVKIDGYKLFDIAAFSNEETFPISRRIELVENELNGIISNQLYNQGLFSQGFQKETLRISVSERKGEIVIIARDDDKLQERQIMTVTEADAQYNGYSINNWSGKLTEIIRTALIRAQKERQFPFLLRQTGISLGLILLALGLSLFLKKRQKYLRKKRLSLKQEESITEREIPSQDLFSSNTCPIAKAQSEFLENRERYQTFERQHDLIRLRRRLLQLGQVIIWGSIFLLIIQLFPWTRWLRFTILEKLITLLFIYFITLLIIRGSSVLIDQYLQTIIEEEALNPLVSQRFTSRVLTFSEIFKDGLFWLFTVIGTVIGLNVLGINVAAVLTGAGILGLAVTFVAQNIVKDIINGLQILRQDRYAVGDYILLDEKLGLVEKITLSITQIRGPNGRLTTIPNGEMIIIHNLSQEWARMDLIVKVSYDTDINLAMQIMKEIAEKMSQETQWKEAIIEPVVLVGISNLDHTGIELQFWMKTLPQQQWAVAREYRHRLKIAFDEKGIKIGIPQQSLSMQNASLMQDNKSSRVN